MNSMTHNRTLQGQHVVMESGTTVITGTVTRWSEVSIWVTFEDGKEYRFTRSQDGQFRRVGRTTDKYAAPLVFMAADDVAALVARRDSIAEIEQLLEPMPEPPAPVAVTRIEFTPAQATIADRIERVNALAKGWDADDADARAKVQEGSLSSFRIDDLITAAGRQPARRSMRQFLSNLADAVVISEIGRVLEFTDPQKAEQQLGYLAEGAQESYEGWHKPNSTSNASVEISLCEHQAWQSLWRVSTGKRFY